MSETTHPPQLVGTWECAESYKKSGELLPQPVGARKVTYTFAADGTGTLMPGTIAAWPMRWSVSEGKLRLGTGAPKSQSTHAYECPDDDTLVLLDRHGGRNVFKRRACDGE